MIVVILFLYLYSINNRAKLLFSKKKSQKITPHQILTIEYLSCDLDPFFPILQNRKPHTDRRRHQTVQSCHF